MLGLLVPKQVTKTKIDSLKSVTYDYFTPNNETNKPHLVAHWYKDENSQLCCKWVKQ